MNARKLGWGVAAGCLLASVAAFAGSVQQNFTVNLKITPECVVGAGTNMTFADTGYLTSATLDAQATFVVGCTKGTTPTITLSAGSNSASCPAGGTRCMRRGATADYVNYELYSDSGRTDPWTSEQPVTGTGGVTGNAPNKDQTVTVYGRVPAQNTPTPGDYTDTVTATVTF